jgi:GPI mannosyltransferase 3
MPKILNLYVYICIFRLWNALLIQSQFDPDEYWQTLEPAYCQVFRPNEKDANGIPSCEGLTWEWKRRAAQQQHQKQQHSRHPHARQSSAPESSSFTATVSEWIQQCLEGPVRSYASVLPTYLFYQALKFLKWDTTWMVSKGPILLHAVLVAAPTDLAVWYMAHFMTTRSAMTATTTALPGWCLFCSIFSWFNGYALIRTYTNSVETVLLALGTTLVSPVRTIW